MFPNTNFIQKSVTVAQVNHEFGINENMEDNYDNIFGSPIGNQEYCRIEFTPNHYEEIINEDSNRSSFRSRLSSTGRMHDPYNDCHPSLYLIGEIVDSGPTGYEQLDHSNWVLVQKYEPINHNRNCPTKSDTDISVIYDPAEVLPGYMSHEDGQVDQLAISSLTGSLDFLDEDGTDWGWDIDNCSSSECSTIIPASFYTSDFGDSSSITSYPSTVRSRPSSHCNIDDLPTQIQISSLLTEPDEIFPMFAPRDTFPHIKEPNEKLHLSIESPCRKINKESTIYTDNFTQTDVSTTIHCDTHVHSLDSHTSLPDTCKCNIYLHDEYNTCTPDKCLMSTHNEYNTLDRSNIGASDKYNICKMETCRKQSELYDPDTTISYPNLDESELTQKASNKKHERRPDVGISRSPVETSIHCFANDDIPFMLDAFKHLIEQTVNVMELLPHLTFILANEFSEDDVKSESVARLLTMVEDSEERGKWTALINALELADYGYIARLLRGETEQDYAMHRSLLRLFTPTIMDRIASDIDTFTDILIENDVINDRDNQGIQREKDRRGSTAASFLLIDRIPRRHEHWFDLFLAALKQCGMGDIVDMLDTPEL